MQKTPQPVKLNIQTLYARILEGIRAQMDEAEMLSSEKCWPFPSYGKLLFSVY